MEEVKVGEVLLSKEDLQKVIKTKRGNFVVKVADPLDKKAIIRNTAAATGNVPIDSIPVIDYSYMSAIETLKIVIVESPDWFVGVESCIDDELIMHLYNEYVKFETNFRRRLREGKIGGSSGGNKSS